MATTKIAFAWQAVHLYVGGGACEHPTVRGSAACAAPSDRVGELYSAYLRFAFPRQVDAPDHSKSSPYNEDMVPAARLAFGMFAIAGFGNELSAQACRTFDVASIKLNTSGLGGGYPELAPGSRRFSATGQLMIEVIMSAYDVSPLQISGIPSAFSQERYDIDATCEQPMTKEQIPHLLQELLAERFHLSVHRELKEEPVFALILGKGGPKFHESSQEGGKPSLRQSNYRFTFTNAGMSNLVGVLSQLSGRKVLDRTGLHGQYDFTLSYAPNPAGAASPAAEGLPDSVFTALREQLGLSLEAQKSQVEFIVVDRLDRLIPN